MSITASFVLGAVLVLRFCLSKAPKIFSYVLWAVVFFRLLCPVSFSSPISFFHLLSSLEGSGPPAVQGHMEYVPPEIGQMHKPEVNLGIEALTERINQNLPAATPWRSVNPMQLYLFFASRLWALGAALLLGYAIISYRLLCRRLKEAVLLPDTRFGKVYETEGISSPFVCGLFHPAIYLPLNLKKAQKEYVLLHEAMHIRRQDCRLKPLAFLILCLHWFNPLVWLAFFLMAKDMEMSCDEQVVGELVRQGRKEAAADYSEALLSLAVVGHSLPAPSPLTFGETGVKSRIRRILTYRQPGFWLKAFAFTLCLVMGLSLLANPPAQGAQGMPVQKQEAYSEMAWQLYGYQTPYVGNNSAVGNLLNSLPLPSGVSSGTFSLETSAPPYGLNKSYRLLNDEMIPEEGEFLRNTCMLFAVIHNVDTITHTGYWSNPLLSSLGFRYQYTRQEIEDFLGYDPREKNQSPEKLQELWDEVSRLISQGTIMDQF